MKPAADELAQSEQQELAQSEQQELAQSEQQAAVALVNVSMGGSQQSRQAAQIAALRLQGMTYRQIGAQMNISREWVRVHLKKVNLAGRNSGGTPSDAQLRDLVELCVRP